MINIAAGLARVLAGLLAHRIRPMDNNAVMDVQLPSLFQPVPRRTTLKDVRDLIDQLLADIAKERVEVHQPKG